MAVSLAPELTEPVTGSTCGMAWRGSSVTAQILVLTTRSLRALLIDPRLILANLLGPLLMLLVVSQIFASVATTPSFPPNVRYLDFLVPAIMVNAVMQSALHTATGLTQDMKNGIVARFRSLPIWLGSVLLARSLADFSAARCSCCSCWWPRSSCSDFSRQAEWSACCPPGDWRWWWAGDLDGSSLPSHAGCATRS